MFVYLHAIRVHLLLVHFSNSFHLLLVPHLLQVFLQFLLIQRLCALFLELQWNLPQSLLLSRHCLRLAGPSKENVTSNKGAFITLAHFSNSFHLLVLPQVLQVFLQFFLIQLRCPLFLELHMPANLPQILLLSRHWHNLQVCWQCLLIQPLCTLFLELHQPASLPQDLLLSRHCLAGPSKENHMICYVKCLLLVHFSNSFLLLLTAPLHFLQVFLQLLLIQLLYLPLQ